MTFEPSECRAPGSATRSAKGATMTEKTIVCGTCGATHDGFPTDTDLVRWASGRISISSYEDAANEMVVEQWCGMDGARYHQVPHDIGAI